jgi:sterol desaturase/sphingolipid hydroxylase (fatty acid hydroxylase superfamily)
MVDQDVSAGPSLFERVVMFLAFGVLSSAAALLAAYGGFLIWLPFSTDPPDTATGLVIGFGCLVLAIAILFAWAARLALRAARN